MIADVHRERDDGDDEDEGKDPVEDAGLADLFHQGVEHCGGVRRGAGRCGRV